MYQPPDVVVVPVVSGLLDLRYLVRVVVISSLLTQVFKNDLYS